MTQHIEYCHSCGSAISEPSAFCANCGAHLAEPEYVGTGSASATSVSAGAPGPRQEAATAKTPGTQGNDTQSVKTSPRGAPPQAGAPSGDQQPKSRRNWIPIAAVGGGALVALGLVVVLLITLGGSAGKDVKSASATREQALQLLAANGTTTVSRAAPGLFALISAGQLSAAVPAGWRATAQTAANATRAEFADPAHPTSTLTIVAQKGNGNYGHRQALAARQAVSAKGDTISSFGHVSFPGGREAWRLTYTATGATHATYFFPACNTHVAMVVDVSAAGSVFQHEQASLEALAASAESKC